MRPVLPVLVVASASIALQGLDSLNVSIYLFNINDGDWQVVADGCVIHASREESLEGVCGFSDVVGVVDDAEVELPQSEVPSCKHACCTD